MSELRPELLVLPLLLLLPVVLMFAFSRWSGWTTLAEAYPLNVEFPPPKTRMGYGVFRRWIGYNGGLIVASDATGLYLKTWPVLVPFHPPVYIPWAEVTQIDARSGGLGGSYQIHLARAPQVVFGLRPPTFDLVREDARRAGVAGAYQAEAV